MTPHRLRCSLNVSFFARGRPLSDALDAAVAHGFRTIELLDPYAYDPDELDAALTARGLKVSLINLPMGDFAAGDRGYAGDPRRREQFRSDVEVAARVIERLRPTKVNALAGNRVEGWPEADQRLCLVDQLGWAAERLAGLGVVVTTELLNPIETPDFLLSSIEPVIEVLDRLDGRVGFQLDVYHLRRCGYDVLAMIDELALRTAHIQIADAPDRTEPGSGDIDFEAVFSAIVESGYVGLIGCEFHPSSAEADAFGWMDGLGVARA